MIFFFRQIANVERRCVWNVATTWKKNRDNISSFRYWENVWLVLMSDRFRSIRDTCYSQYVCYLSKDFFIKTVTSVSCRSLHAQSTWRLGCENRKQTGCLPIALPFCSIQCSRASQLSAALGVGVAGEKLCMGNNTNMQAELSS